MSDANGAPTAKRARKSANRGGMNGHSRPAEPITEQLALQLGPPKRWLYCPPMGKEISGFLPIKTPLAPAYDGCLPDAQFRFTPADVFAHAPQRFEPRDAKKKIGMWIDLTKTSRYYDKDEVEKRGVAYVKMPLAGHGESPSREDVDRFLQCVREFRAGIYKDDYLNDLKAMFPDAYDEGDAIPYPGRPAWEDEDAGPPADFFAWRSGANGAPGSSGFNANGDAGPSTSQQQQQNGRSKPQFMDGRVPDVHLVEDAETIAYCRGQIKEKCGYRKPDFPGSQPVSLERSSQFDNLKLLAQEEYMVSWKADGMRYLVLIEDEGLVYAFDRDNNVFELRGLQFPHRKWTPEQPRFVKQTLVDAEMVIDSLDGVETPRLLIYDIIAFEQTEIGKCNFRVRHGAIARELIEPRTRAKERGLITREPMSVRRKDFWEVSATAKLLSADFQAQMPHEVDGLIFQPVAGGYVAGRYDKLLKWKPQDLSTIDFLLQIRKEEKRGQIPEYQGYLYVLGRAEPFGQMKPLKAHLPYNGKIVECQWVNNQWKILRERTDKSHPNAWRTAESVCRCIMSPITTEVLLNFIQQHCRPRPPPPPQQQRGPGQGQR
ncbi:MRNA-capping enzyme [Aphelenchoides fujianensis]|nr:MRNA-capping enzyme [Aphelenchoides fujianensis]